MRTWIPDTGFRIPTVKRKSIAAKAACVLLLAGIWNLASGIRLFAEFDDTGTGARPIGLGNAFTALADDVQTIVYNPAGLANQKRCAFSADYGQLFVGLDDKSVLSTGFIGYVLPISRKKSLDERIRDLRKITAAETSVDSSTGAAQMRNKNAQKKEDITFFRDLGTVGFGLSNLSLSGAVSENKFFFSYGRKIIPRLSGGISIKLLYETYNLDDYTRRDPVFDYGGKTSLIKYSADMGVLYNLSPKIFWGLAITDINRPNMALNPADKDILPMGVRNGFCYKEKVMNASFDVLYNTDQKYKIQAGAERWFKSRTYALRMGGGFGSQDYKNVTYGMSVNWGNVQIDYAFLYPISGVRDTYGNHRLSFVYRFGKAPLNELETGSLELYYSKLQTEVEVLRAKLEKSEDERTRMEKILVEEALSRIKEKVRAEKLEATMNTSVRKDAPLGTKLLPMMGGTMTTPSGMKTYVTVKGDTLQSIADLFYGKKERWLEILNLNKDKVGRGGSIKQGTVLLIPGVPGASVSLEESVLGAQGRTLAPAAGGQTLAPLSGSARENTLSPVTGKTLSPIRKEEKSRRASSSTEMSTSLKTYTVQPGDTLNSIAQTVYGDQKRWKDIYNANKDKIERGTVNAGQVLTIP